MKRNTAFFGIASVLAVVAFVIFQSDSTTPTPTPDTTSESALATVKVPDLTDSARVGETIFTNVCAVCHGPNGEGQNGVAPPLVHVIYESGHHGDEAFQRAAAYGVKSHHWRFGNMPPVEGVSRGDIRLVVTYIRELQRANGIN